MIVEGSGPGKSASTDRRERSMVTMPLSPEGYDLNIPGGEEEIEGSRPGQVTVDMAQSKYLYQIPFSVTREIVMSMDSDKSWESLAGEIGYSFDKIKHFELEYQKYTGSPTKALLWDWGSRNATVKELYGKLKVLHRVREMRVLENYVTSANESSNSKSDKLINCDKAESVNKPLPSISTINIDDLPKPPPPRRQPSEVDSDSKDVNFNQPKGHVTKSKLSSKVLADSSVKDKQYDDKKIPGFKSDSKMAEAHSHVSHSSRVPQESVSTTSSESSKATESTDSSSFDLSSLEKSDPMKGFETLKSYMKTESLSFDDAVALMGTPNFEYKELFEATDGFGTSHKVGAGAFGTVYRGTLRCSKCAIKKLDGENKDMKNENSSQLRSELTALLRYRHENIVNLYGYALDGPSLCLVYQYMVNASLEDRLQCKDNTPPLTWDKRIIIASGAAKGLQFLHNFGSKPLIHGDIKSANILLDKHYEAKIGDLGQAQHANSGTLTGKFTHITQKNASSKMYGTKAYLAPELLRGGGNISVKSDVYAFGVVLMEICSGEKSLDDKREGNKFLRDYFLDLKDEAKDDDIKLCKLLRDKRAGNCPETILLDLIKSAANCLEDKKKDRITMEKLLHHLESIEERWKETQSSSPDISSFSGSVHSHHLSHSSGDDYSAPNLAQPSFVTPGKQPPSAHPRKDCAPTSPVEYLKGKDFSSLPEPFRLQVLADARKEGKTSEFDQIATYKALNKQLAGQETGSMEEYVSDPQKMQQIEKYNAELVMESDPRKIEALKMFDKEKRMTREPDESSENGSHMENTGDFIAADSEKLKKLEEFDRQNSSGSMHSGLLYGDQSSYVPHTTVSVHQQMMPGVSSQVVSGHSQFSYVQTGIPSAVNDSMRHLNVASHSPGQAFNPGSPVGYRSHLGEGQQTFTGGQYQMRQNSGESVSSHSPGASMGSTNFPPVNNENFSGSYFSNESQPTIVHADLPGHHINHAGPGTQMLSSPQPGSPGGNSMLPVLEVCEGSTPMSKQRNMHEQTRSYSVPHQMTDTNTSQHITYVSASHMSHSLPEQTTTSSGQTQNLKVSDVQQTSCYPDDKAVHYRENSRESAKTPVEYRQSEGFPYTGLTVFDHSNQIDDEHLHGDGQSQRHDLPQVEGEDPECNVQRVRESSVDPVEFHDGVKDKKMMNFFESYNQAVANECEGTEWEECGEGEEEEQDVVEEGVDEEGDNTVTDINV